ncbi:hypothetical protein [Xylocopilactobacillus apis]|uniref:DUF5067 domain-containing protein n=1 Tax=Xylocopilactobacillus apis TaxID=2932183 RepID=A0AAU9CY48_9LACO|nr:hypothetical protein [Xylocopilactobacillus apis]BDR56334.1 hypothetical protein KIMC2_08960 [Xylocopilactobacillus apis]
MQRKTNKQKLSSKELINLIEILTIILILIFISFFLGHLSGNKQKVIKNIEPKGLHSSTFFMGKTYSAVYKSTDINSKSSDITHNITIYFKSDGTMIEKDEQINPKQSNTNDLPNKITVYSATTEINSNIIQSKTSSLVESKYNSHKKLKAKLPYDVRARGQAFNYPLKDTDPKQFLFSINNDSLLAITNDGHIVKLVKSTERLNSLKEYAQIFGKQRDRNDQAKSEEKDDADNNKNQLVQTQENSDGVYFIFGYFENGKDNQYTVDLKISNPTNKTQYVTLNQVIFQSTSNKYIPNSNYKGQIEIPSFSSKYLPAFFDNITYNDIFGQFMIYYSTETNPIIKHDFRGKFPSNFNEGQLENSGI